MRERYIFEDELVEVVDILENGVCYKILEVWVEETHGK